MLEFNRKWRLNCRARKMIEFSEKSYGTKMNLIIIYYSFGWKICGRRDKTKRTKEKQRKKSPYFTAWRRRRLCARAPIELSNTFDDVLLGRRFMGIKRRLIHIFYFCIFVYSVRTVRRDIAPNLCRRSSSRQRAACLAAPEILRFDSQNNNKWNVPFAPFVLLCNAIARQTRIGNNCADTCPERNSKFTFRCASSNCRAFRCECTTEKNASNTFKFENRCIDVQRGIGLDHTRHSLARTRAHKNQN